MGKGPKVVELSHHRNGVSGEPFWVGIIKDEGRKMLAVRFRESDGACAVFDLALLANHDIAFGSNSWRGDHYIDAMDAAIDKAK